MGIPDPSSLPPLLGKHPGCPWSVVGETAAPVRDEMGRMLAIPSKEAKPIGRKEAGGGCRFASDQVFGHTGL